MFSVSEINTSPRMSYISTSQEHGVEKKKVGEVVVEISESADLQNPEAVIDDPWALETEEATTSGPRWSELSGKSKALEAFIIVLRFSGILACLYFFICSLTLLGSAFQLLGGRTIGQAFRNSKVLRNPFCGLVIGIVVTAVLQSSSTSTSIVVTMVAAGAIPDVRVAIPIVMGANIGTSVTGIIVSVVQSGNKQQFRRAFGAATVHDMFNWLSVITILPLEVAFNFIYRLTDVIAKSAKLSVGMRSGGKKPMLLQVLVKPVTNLIVQLDKKVFDAIAIGDEVNSEKPLLKYWCKTRSIPNENFTTTADGWMNVTKVISPTVEEGVQTCRYLFHSTNLPEGGVGALLLLMSLAMLITCLLFLVKVLKSLLSGHLAAVVKKTINANFPFPFGWLTGYLAVIVGCVFTILVQSSSVVTSTLTPLVGVGMVTIQRVYPMMLGANIGTTSTAFLAAFSSPPRTVTVAFQIALCHLCFNIIGIIIWYPVPLMRKVPIGTAQFLGNTTAEYRWFAFAYLIVMFFILPLSVFGLSLAGWPALGAVFIPIILLLFFIGITNWLQIHKPKFLPRVLRTWDFLPVPLRSLRPYDHVVRKICFCCKCCQPLEDDTSPLKKLVARTPSNVRERIGSMTGNAMGGKYRSKYGTARDSEFGEYEKQNGGIHNPTPNVVSAESKVKQEKTDSKRYETAKGTVKETYTQTGTFFNKGFEGQETPL